MLADWVDACSDLPAPLVDAIGRHVVAGGKRHADDTPLPALAPGLGKTKTARLWTVAFGRKNFLFGGADSGGELVVAMYSLIAMVKGNGVDFKAYLSHALDRIAEHPINRIDDLLPSHVASNLPSFTANA